MLAISPRLYVGFDTLPQAAEEFAFPAGTAFWLMAAAILAGAGMHVVVLLSTGVVLPWRELLAGEPVWATGVTVRASLGTPGEVLRPVRRRERRAPDSGGTLGPPRPSRRPSVASWGRFFRRSRPKSPFLAFSAGFSRNHRDPRPPGREPHVILSDR